MDPISDKLILPEKNEQSDPSWFGFLLSVRPNTGIQRNDLTQYLERHNVQTRLLFSGNYLKHPCFESLHGTGAYRVVGDLTNTDIVMGQSFWIGVYPGMTKEMLDYMIKLITDYMNVH